MDCFSPRVVWSEKLNHGVDVPCGKCEACLSTRRLQWFTRLKFECDQFVNKCVFITLTYDDDHLPNNGMLCKSDLQKFWKRLRKYINFKIRYFNCGEYGEHTLRPHYHAIIFNLDPIDAVDLVSRSWDLGFTSCSPVSDNRLMYVAKYIVKSLGDFQNRPDYVKPFISCSRGLGLDTFIQNHEIYENLGSIKINGHYCSVPRYFRDKVYSDEFNPFDKSDQIDWTIIKFTGDQRRRNYLSKSKLFKKGVL